MDSSSLTEHLEYGLLRLRLLALAVHVRVLGEARRLPDLETEVILKMVKLFLGQMFCLGAGKGVMHL